MSASTLDERIRAIVERTLAAQGLSLEVRDPVALHVIATEVLVTRAKHNSGRVAGRDRATLRRRGKEAAKVAIAIGAAQRERRASSNSKGPGRPPGPSPHHPYRTEEVIGA